MSSFPLTPVVVSAFSIVLYIFVFAFAFFLLVYFRKKIRGQFSWDPETIYFVVLMISCFIRVAQAAVAISTVTLSHSSRAFSALTLIGFCAFTLSKMVMLYCWTRTVTHLTHNHDQQRLDANIVRTNRIFTIFTAVTVFLTLAFVTITFVSDSSSDLNQFGPATFFLVVSVLAALAFVFISYSVRRQLRRLSVPSKASNRVAWSTWLFTMSNILRALFSILTMIPVVWVRVASHDGSTDYIIIIEWICDLIPTAFVLFLLWKSFMESVKNLEDSLLKGST
jgi:hypothetical protein